MPDGGIAQIVLQAGLSAIFIWLYFDERSAHKATRTKDEKIIADLNQLRLDDAVQTRDKVTATLSGISQTLDNINTKIVISKENER